MTQSMIAAMTAALLAATGAIAFNQLSTVTGRPAAASAAASQMASARHCHTARKPVLVQFFSAERGKLMWRWERQEVTACVD
jgi:hypothetical protein